MENRKHRDTLIERRHVSTEESLLWDRLTLAQKFSASSLTKYGFDLAFIRNSNTGGIAILLCNGKASTVSADGEINTNPMITIRH